MHTTRAFLATLALLCCTQAFADEPQPQAPSGGTDTAAKHDAAGLTLEVYKLQYQIHEALKYLDEYQKRLEKHQERTEQQLENHKKHTAQSFEDFRNREEAERKDVLRQMKEEVSQATSIFATWSTLISVIIAVMGIGVGFGVGVFGWWKYKNESHQQQRRADEHFQKQKERGEELHKRHEQMVEQSRILVGKTEQDQAKIAQIAVSYDTSIVNRPAKEDHEVVAKEVQQDVAMLASREKNWDAAQFLWGLVLRARPDDYDAKYQLAEAKFYLALALQDQAGTIRDNNTKRELYHNAIRLLDEAMKLEPGTNPKSSILNNWGVCLMGLADIEKDPRDKKELLKKTLEKVKEAASTDRDNDPSWNSWEACLQKLAGLGVDISSEQQQLDDARGRQKKRE